MRIIAGQLGGRRLKVPKGQLTRPSTDRVRESLFNLVTNRCTLNGARVLDLFAGTGSLGLEAISRGAQSVTFVEWNRQVMDILLENARSLDVESQCFFVRAEATGFITRYAGPPFTLILADPPYDLTELTTLPERAQPHLDEDGLFVLEHDARHHFDDHPNLDVSRAYGRTIVSIFRADDT
jgi:16S rRNA (guanine(966)-N(2))-methyltransferase RsmD